MTKDKIYIENLLRKYKRNVARLKALENNLLSDDDNILGAIDYSKERVQTSTLSSLDNIIERREAEAEQLRKDIELSKILIDSLNKKDRFIIESIFLENIRYIDIAYELNYNDKSTVWDNKERILKNLLDIIN